MAATVASLSYFSSIYLETSASFCKEFNAYLNDNSNRINQCAQEFFREVAYNDQAVRCLKDRVKECLKNPHQRHFDSEALISLDLLKTHLDQYESRKLVVEIFKEIAERGQDYVSVRRGIKWLGFHTKAKDGYCYDKFLSLFAKGEVFLDGLLELLNQSSSDEISQYSLVVDRFAETHSFHNKSSWSVPAQTLQLTKIIMNIAKIAPSQKCLEQTTLYKNHLMKELFNYFDKGDPKAVVEKVKNVRNLLDSYLKVSSDAKVLTNTIIGDVSWINFHYFAEVAIKKVENYLISDLRLDSSEMNTQELSASNSEYGAMAKKPDPYLVDFNNYGIIPQGITRDSNNNITSFDYLDKNSEIQTFVVDSRFPVILKNGVVLSERNGGTLENHDVIGKHDFNNGNGILMVLCDGCGQSHAAKKAALFVVDSMVSCLSEIYSNAKTTHESLRCQFSALKKTQHILGGLTPDEYGDTTLAQVFIKGDFLTGIIVGDAKIFILKYTKETSWICVEPTKIKGINKDSTDSLGRIVGNKTYKAPPEFDSVLAVSYPLQKGDVVIVASDGVSDCFEPKELKDGSTSLETNIAAALSKISPEEPDLHLRLERKIKEILQARTIEEKILQFQGSFKNGHRPGWGKMDNANMGFYIH